jgi:hypothetical protein
MLGAVVEVPEPTRQVGEDEGACRGAAPDTLEALRHPACQVGPARAVVTSLGAMPECASFCECVTRWYNSRSCRTRTPLA